MQWLPTWRLGAHNVRVGEWSLFSPVPVVMVVTLAVFGVVETANAQSAYKIVGPDGRVTYSDTPPNDASDQSKAVDVTPATGPRSAAPAQRSPPPPQPSQSRSVRAVIQRAPTTAMTFGSPGAPPTGVISFGSTGAPPTPTSNPSAADAAAPLEAKRPTAPRGDASALPARQEPVAPVQPAALESTHKPVAAGVPQIADTQFAAPAHSGADALSSGSDQEIGQLLMLKVVCDTTIPGFKARSTAAYDAWRIARQEQIARVVKNYPMFGPAGQAAMEKNAIKAQQSPINGDPAELALQCEEGVLNRFIETTSPDPAFSSPQKTWERMLDALRSANRTQFLSCMTAAMRIKLAKQFETLRDDQLKEMANHFHIEQFYFVAYGAGPNKRAEGIMRSPDGKTTDRVIFDLDFGNWKIGEM